MQNQRKHATTGFEPGSSGSHSEGALVKMVCCLLTANLVRGNMIPHRPK